MSEAKRDVMAIGHQQLRYTSWGAEIGVSCTMSVTFLRHEALISSMGESCTFVNHDFTNHLLFTCLIETEQYILTTYDIWCRCFTFQFTLVYWCRGSFIWKYRYCILIGVCILSNLFSSTLLHLHRFSLFVNV